MKRLSFIFLLLSIMLVTSCSIYQSYGFNYKQLNSIERGMDFKAVTAILGKPAFRNLNKKGETWVFRALGLSGWSIVKVSFIDGKVIEMESYLEDACQNKRSEDKSFFLKNEDSSKEESSSKIIVSPEGKHYIKMGSIIVTPEGKHIIMP